MPVPQVGPSDLVQSAFDYFKKNAARTRRIAKEDLDDGHDILLEKLHLVDGAYLKRAAVLLFHSDPEKYVSGAYVKIGYFESDDELLFQDEIRGHLFDQVEKTMDLLLTKYLRATISYHGLQRLESFPYPEPALREALLNAIAHKDYGSGNPVQISVYADKIIFWNEGQLPDNWTVAHLASKHPSVPFNPDIARVLFRAGLIEAWGRGTIKIINECKIAKLPRPIFKYDLSGFILEFHSPKAMLKESKGGPALLDASIIGSLIAAIVKGQDPSSLTDEILEGYKTTIEKLEEKSFLMVKAMFNHGPMKRSEILSAASLSNQSTNVRRYFDPLVIILAVDPTHKDRPSSRH